MCLRCKLVTIGHLWVIGEIYFRDICQHLQRKTRVDIKLQIGPSFKINIFLGGAFIPE